MKQNVQVHKRVFGFKTAVASANWNSVRKLGYLVLTTKEQADLTYKFIADKAGVCPSTVSNFARSNTRYPRYQTVIGVLSALGYEVTVKHD